MVESVTFAMKLILKRQPSLTRSNVRSCKNWAAKKLLHWFLNLSSHRFRRQEIVGGQRLLDLLEVERQGADITCVQLRDLRHLRKTLSRLNLYSLLGVFTNKSSYVSWGWTFESWMHLCGDARNSSRANPTSIESSRNQSKDRITMSRWKADCSMG